MHNVTLPGTTIMTSRLGFGTAGLLRLTSRRARENVLSAAMDAGMRHFDTAPIYGLGEAERLLGEFLQGRNEEVTITSKFGLQINAATARLRGMQAAGRTLLKCAPFLRRWVKGRSGALYARPSYTAHAARASLSASLSALRRTRLDLLLLHDCKSEHLTDPALPDALRRMQEDGVIRAFGIATHKCDTLALLQSAPALCAVTQIESAAVPEIAALPGSMRGIITHSVLQGAFNAVRIDPALRARWSQMLEVNLSQDAALSDLFIRAALASNPSGIVLIHSNSPQHVLRNARATEQALDPEQVSRFHRLLGNLSLNSIAAPTTQG